MLDTTVPLQKARKLLAWLATQPSDVFWSFQYAIRQDCLQTEAVHRLAVSDKEMRDLMERVKNISLPETLDLKICRGVLKAREQLRKTYRSRDELLMSAGLAKGKTMTMDKILVNVCLLSSEEVKNAFEKPLFSSHQDRERCEYLFSKILQGQPSFLTLEELFKSKRRGEKDPDKVMASGGAGCGKSVCFTRKAPFDWATGELWQEFALLFCLELRDKSAWQAKAPADLLKLAQLNLNAKEQEEVVEFITDHPDKVVIVCDGLDESICDLFRDEQKLPSRRTEIFQKIIVALLNRYAQKRDSYVPFQDWTDAPASLLELVIGLGKVAFQGLQKKQLYFTDVELIKAGMPLEALELGLLVKSESTNFWKLSEYTFSHLTVQEFLAAWYVSSEVLRADADMAKLLVNVSFSDGHLTTFWTFLAGVLEGRWIEALLSEALSGMAGSHLDYWSRHNHRLQLYRCYAESMLAQSGFPSASINKLLNDYQVKYVHVSLSVSDCAAICTALQSHPQTERMHTVHIVECNMHDAGLSQLLPGLLRCNSIKSFDMSHNIVSSQHMSVVSAILANNASTLEAVDWSGNRIGHASLEKLSEGLKHCRKLKELWLPGNDLTPRSAVTLSDLLPSLPSLEEFSVSENDLGANSMAQLADGLQFCTHLKRLYLRGTALSSESFPVLHHLLSSLPSLKVVLGSHNFDRENKEKLLCGVSPGRIHLC